MADKKRIEDKERILSFLLRKGSLCNTYKVARELGMQRWDVLERLQELVREGKVKLAQGSVKVISEELSRADDLKIMSEVDNLKERVDKLEKVIKFTFSQLIESVQMGYQKMSTKKQLNDDNEVNLKDKG